MLPRNNRQYSEYEDYFEIANHKLITNFLSVRRCHRNNGINSDVDVFKHALMNMSPVAQM